MIQVQQHDFDPGAVIAAMHQDRSDIGAITTFVGLVRDMTDNPLTGFTLEHYPGMTEKQLQAIVTEAYDRWNLDDVVVIHRYGELKPSDRIVLVAVASFHRGAAFDACEFIIDYLKTRATFWKKESHANASSWVEGKTVDQDKANRWQTSTASIPMLAISGQSGVGKTTLLEQLIPQLQAKGIRVGMIKHSHHHFDIDRPGKDSHRLRQAGAKQVILASDHKVAVMLEQSETVRLPQLQRHFNRQEIDLVLVEGFKPEPTRKIWLIREPEIPDPFTPDQHCIAIATDSPRIDCQGLPRLDINNIEQIAHFMQQQIGLKP